MTSYRLLEKPPVRLFVLGANTWRDADDWPLPGTRFVPYYLRGGGRANTLDGDGTLSLELPTQEPPDSYVYDPADPTPSVPGRDARFAGPFDQRSIERRPDVLVHSTPPLEPGRVYEYTVELRPVGNRFAAGHRIRLEVASASFPEYDRNMNTGNPCVTDAVGTPATQLVFHDAGRPSQVVLPVVG